MKYTEEQIHFIQERIKNLQDELNSLSNQLGNSSGNKSDEPIEELYSFSIPYNANLTKGDRYYIGVDCMDCIRTDTHYLFCTVTYVGRSPVNPNSHMFETHNTFLVRGVDVNGNEKRVLSQRDISKIEKTPLNYYKKFSDLISSLEDTSENSEPYRLFLIKDDIKQIIPSIQQTQTFEKYWDLVSHIPITLEKKLYHFPNDFITY